jgi:hypothetical protein
VIKHSNGKEIQSILFLYYELRVTAAFRSVQKLHKKTGLLLARFMMRTVQLRSCRFFTCCFFLFPFY